MEGSEKTSGLRVASIDVGTRRLGLAMLHTRGAQTEWDIKDGDQMEENAMVRFISNNCCVESVENIDMLSFSKMSNGRRVLFMTPAERCRMVVDGLLNPRLELLGLHRDADGALRGDPALSAVVIERQPSFNRRMEIVSESIGCTLHMIFDEILKCDIEIRMLTGSWKMKVCELFAHATGIGEMDARDKYSWNKKASVATVKWLSTVIDGFMSASASAALASLPDEKLPDACDAILQGVSMLWALERKAMGRRPSRKSSSLSKRKKRSSVTSSSISLSSRNKRARLESSSAEEENNDH